METVWRGHDEEVGDMGPILGFPVFLERNSFNGISETWVLLARWRGGMGVVDHPTSHSWSVWKASDLQVALCLERNLLAYELIH